MGIAKIAHMALLGAVLAASLSACEENPAREYGQGLVRTLDKADRAADTANLNALRQSLESYRALNGKYPDSLDEIARQMGLDPSRFDYDPATGRVALKGK